MAKTHKDVWVFIEHHNAQIADVSLELLSKGRKLANEIGGELKAVVLGENTTPICKETFKFGAQTAITIDAPALAEYRTMPYSRLLSDLVATRQPRIVLFGATFIGRDIAPRVASFTKSGLTADCTDLQISDVKYLKQEYAELLLQIRPAFGGNIIATIITPETAVQMATVREGVMEMAPLDKPVAGNIEKLAYKANPVDEVIEIIEKHKEDNKVNLKAAPIIISGGYGMGTRENFNLLYELADILGAEVAGTRAAVDAGFIDHDRQVGQTGVTVRPKLYIACGISGAIQHRAGMQDANKIIAINTDADAPIFDICHYGIVGDVGDVIPKFIETYKQKLK
jgi:electron transfer flavoprotein alpha subunit